MQKGREITRGKTKILYEAEGQPDLAVVESMDSITAGDGARRNEIEGKGRIAAKTTARIFRLLNLCGVPTHYISGGEDDDNNEMLVRRAQMIPLKVVTRGIAAGSLCAGTRASRAARSSSRACSSSSSRTTPITIR